MILDLAYTIDISLSMSGQGYMLLLLLSGSFIPKNISTRVNRLKSFILEIKCHVKLSQSNLTTSSAEIKLYYTGLCSVSVSAWSQVHQVKRNVIVSSFTQAVTPVRPCRVVKVTQIVWQSPFLVSSIVMHHNLRPSV